MIVITGASGKTGSKAAEALLKTGENTRVIGRSPEHLQHLTEQGAEAMIGDQGNVEFLTRAFSGADAAYVIIPPKYDTDNVRAHYNKMGAVIVDAVRRSELRKMVFLSSLGAEHDTGTGPVVGLHDVEKALDTLSDVDIVFLRPGYFFENTLMNIEQIKNRRIFASDFDPDASILMVASRDIGQKAADLLLKHNFRSHTVEELFGHRITLREVSRLIGQKLDIPHIAYVRASDGEAIDGMMAMGLSRNIAESFVELSQGISKGMITTTMLDPRKPNAPTRYHKFIDEALATARKKAA
jgi:uncharacterized protein YbjT (DUF2867 family)